MDTTLRPYVQRQIGMIKTNNEYDYYGQPRNKKLVTKMKTTIFIFFLYN